MEDEQRCHEMMRESIICITLAASCLIDVSAQAQVTVKDIWVRATVPQQKATGAFMQLQSAPPLKLVAASSPLTPVMEVREMAMQNDVMTCNDPAKRCTS